jgi:hypothetical protein
MSDKLQFVARKLDWYPGDKLKFVEHQNEDFFTTTQAK